MKAQFRKFFLSSAAALSLIACGTEQNQMAEMASAEEMSEEQNALDIISGKQASKQVASSTVALLVSGGLCSGTIIHPQYVLTASHCVDTLSSPSQAQVVFAQNASDPKAIRRNVVKIFNLNKPFNINKADIAIVQISGDLPAGYVAAALPAANESLPAGKEFIIAGYGKSSLQSNSSGSLLQGAGKMVAVAKTHFLQVANVGGTQHCNGDSGGPTFIQKGKSLVVVGVTSHGTVACSQGSFVTDVRQQLAWIKKTVPVK